MCAEAVFAETHIENVGIDLNSNYVIAGAQDEYGCPKFDNLSNHEKRPECPEIYYDKAEKEIVKVCFDFCKAHPNIGAIMLECTGMQPFARAVHRETSLPVFS